MKGKIEKRDFVIYPFLQKIQKLEYVHKGDDRRKLNHKEEPFEIKFQIDNDILIKKVFNYSKKSQGF